MTKKTESIQRLLEVTGKPTLQGAVQTVEQVLTVAAQQNFTLSNIGVLTIVYGPQGMGFFTLSPDASSSVEKLDMVERALLDFQASLIQRRKTILASRPSQEESRKGDN